MRFQILKAVTIRFNPCETKSSRWKKKEKKTFYFRIRRKNFFSNTRPISAKYFLYIESRGWWKSRKAKVVSKFRPMNQHHLLSTPLSACPSINQPRWARYSAHFLVDRSGNTSLSLSRDKEREREVRYACFESTGVSPLSRSLGIAARLLVATALSPFFLRGCLATTIVTVRPIMWFIPLCSR